MSKKGGGVLKIITVGDVSREVMCSKRVETLTKMKAKYFSYHPTPHMKGFFSISPFK